MALLGPHIHGNTLEYNHGNHLSLKNVRCLCGCIDCFGKKTNLNQIQQCLNLNYYNITLSIYIQSEVGGARLIYMEEQIGEGTVGKHIK